MNTFVATTGKLSGEGPVDEETGEGSRLPKDETEARELAELQALARRLPEIRVVLSCSRAPDGVVNALPTVVDIPSLGEFHETNAGVWCSQDGRQLLSCSRNWTSQC